MTDEPISEEDKILADQNSKASLLFDEMCMRRHTLGAEEYGMFTFLENDVMRMLLEELIDVSNYARMQFIKLILLQEILEEILGPEKLAAQAFQGTGARCKHPARSAFS